MCLGMQVGLRGGSLLPLCGSQGWNSGQVLPQWLCVLSHLTTPPQLHFCNQSWPWTHDPLISVSLSSNGITAQLHHACLPALGVLFHLHIQVLNPISPPGPKVPSHRHPPNSPRVISFPLAFIIMNHKYKYIWVHALNTQADMAKHTRNDPCHDISPGWCPLPTTAVPHITKQPDAHIHNQDNGGGMSHMSLTLWGLHGNSYQPGHNYTHICQGIHLCGP